MNALLSFALERRVLVALVFVLVLVGGGVAFSRLNIEAYPDPVPPLVDIITQSSGLSAEEMERYITIPIENQMAGVPNLRVMRTTSVFGLSDVKLQFTYDFTYDQALQQVLNRLAQLPALPTGAQPQISPVSPIGEIFRYRVVGPPGYALTDLRTIQDWILARRFKAVSGVIDVTGWGGTTKTYEVTVDFQKLIASGLTLTQVMQALQNANINVGGNTIEIGPQAGVVRGVGLIRSIDDIAGTLITQSNGTPVRVRDIATVSVGHLPRLGIAGMNDTDDVVQGIVLMRRGEKSMPTLQRVEAEVQRINAGGVLPPGVKIERLYDRKELIDITTHTVLHSLVFGVLFVFLVQWVFLGNFRSAVVVAATIPFALFTAVIVMVLMGESANLLSVGALDFGLIVDATVIMVENVFRHLAERSAGHGRFDADEAGRDGFIATILGAAREVIGPIFFSSAIIITGFLPLFMLSGVEGHIFSPMAKTYAYALAGGLFATFTVTPALSAILLKGRLSETETLAVRVIRRIYEPLLDWAIHRRVVVLALAAFVLAGTGLTLRSLGLEFLPKLEEGNMWVRATLHPTISLQEGNAYVNRMRRVIAEFPEVQTAISQQGRPDDGTDVAGFNNAEVFVPLKPREEWRPGLTKERLIEEMNARLIEELPGVAFNFSQYLEDNVAEAASGVKGENSIKVFGSDLVALTRTANAIRDAIRDVPGIRDLAVFNTLGQPTVEIEVDREKAGRFGLQPGDINTAIKTAIAGDTPGDLYERGSDRHFPIMVRLAEKYRASPEAIGELRIGVADGNGGVAQIPLREVATVRLVAGPSYIYREGQQRYVPIKFSVRGRDLGGTVLEAQARVAERVSLPFGSRLEWVGEFGNLQDAVARLQVIVPITLLLIGLLLYAHFASLTDTLLALSVIPMALVGGILALALTGTPFGVSAAIGFIALFGIAVMEGILVIVYYNTLIACGRHRLEAIVEACRVRMRPVLMTCVAACVGLLPAALSTGIGSQVQRPLAFVVVGGIVLAPMLILLVLPVLIVTFSRRQAAQTGAAAMAPAE
ncbi:efflux RND transporter permease subunit [Phreatobacter sp. AB_2022a]|uniref:efflux RND transporter permease subunit n=1 Tax=Phreatobacter sp. AB_2022a TaxID=3003134 RepID=UPI002286D03B|nr:CusA/CzcA family heavy metal efflux RND transporter [Phreatobacter sp. AB_2022a]MCZ0732774.1 CusA/CzcA family heavy metal efflux RND transporter [Phreatobacter sp. AB_2022a]